FLAGLRIERLHLLRLTENEFIVIGQFDDDRRGPGAGPVLAVRTDIAAGLLVLPDRLAVGLVDRQEELPVARAVPEDGEVTVQNGRRRISPNVVQLAQVTAPLLVAV